MKKIFGSLAAVGMAFMLLSGISSPVMAANSAQTNQAFVMRGSNNYIIKKDGTLWDVNTNKKLMGNVIDCGYIGKANTDGGGRYAVKADGTLWELGFTENSYASGKVKWPAEKLISDVKRVYFQPYKSADGWTELFFVIKKDNTLWSCGGWQRSNPGDLKARIAPVKVMDNVESLVFSQDFRQDAGNLFVLKTDGSLWGWGDNANGELADGTTEKREKPLKIMDNVASFAYGFFSGGQNNGGTAYAVKTDGTLLGWGANGCYQLGNGSSTDSHIPVKLMEGVLAVDADSGHVSVLQKDGTLWSWGIKMGATRSTNISKDGGSVSQVSYEYNAAPVKIADQVKYTFSSAHADYFIKNDNTLWYVGGGMLADPLEPTTKAAKLMGNVASIHIYSSYGFAITADHALWGWGHNEMGQLGKGATESQYGSPKKVLEGVKLFSSEKP